jgi:DNA-binding FadR family transcriptional regulator
MSVPQRLDDSESLLAPVRTTTAADEVTDRLATVIALGAFLPGERLPAERELSQLLVVSRSTVREALGRLRSAGLVEVRQGRSGGAFVRSGWNETSASAVRRTLSPRLHQLELLFDLRARVEEMVARAAAERRTADDVRSLRAALAAFAAAREPTDEHRRDTALHDAVLAATGNPHLVSVSRELLARTTLGFPLEPYRQGIHGRALREHGELVAAIVAGDVERAGRAARAHFAMSAETLRETLARGSAGPRPLHSPAAGSGAAVTAR